MWCFICKLTNHINFALIHPFPFSQPILHDINIEIPRGKLLMVVGEVGCGKSSLIAALLGELQAASPDARVEIAGSVAYTAQDPWIQNMTLRDNILMGEEMDEDK